MVQFSSLTTSVIADLSCGKGVYTSFAGRESLPPAADLNTLLAPHTGDTFLMEVGTDVMAEAGICKGDQLVVDRSLAASSGQIVIVQLQEQMILRRYEEVRKTVKLSVDSGKLAPLLIPDHCEEISVWGVVTHLIRRVQ